HGACGCGVRRRPRRARAGGPRPALPTRARQGARAGRRAPPPRRASGDGRRPALARAGRDSPRPRQSGRGAARPRRRPVARERPRGGRGRAPVGGGRELEPRARAGDQGPRSRARFRRGAAMTGAGLFGAYGGRYVPETLVPALDELVAGWEEARGDPAFASELDRLGREYAGRPTPLTLAERFSPGKRIYLKREDLLHTGAHKLNNALGQAVLARRLGKRRIVAETGAGQHGVATATVCARFGLEC